MQKLLFITWDGPQTSYMEGLFMPIFQEISRIYKIEFHILQFTWGSKERTNLAKVSAKKMGIHYQPLAILKMPIALGSLITLLTSTKKIEKYIKENGIDLVMPRSTFPAFIVSRLKNDDIKIIFDADGLPIEERVDFSGLKKDGWQYHWLKSIERKMLLKAHHVITRSQKSIDVHLENIGNSYKDKFSVVYNGRNTSLFSPNNEKRKAIRDQLGIRENEMMMVYCGSLGPQYGWDEMLDVFNVYSKHNSARWLILTGNTQFAEDRIPNNLKEKVIIKKVPFEQVPEYLNAGDIGFAIRKPSFSMQGVAPIKLGEYLLMGMPVIASKGIGDTDEIMNDFPECFSYNHDLGISKQMIEIQSWLELSNGANKENIRNIAKKYFSLEAAADSYIEAFKRL